MKDIRIMAVLLLLSCISLTYAQDQVKVQKVESPFRLFRGVVLKTDLRMTTETLNQIEGGLFEGIHSLEGEGFVFDNFNGKNQITKTIFTRQQGLMNQNSTFQPAIVLDGFIVNDNSQRINPVQFLALDFFWRNRF